MKQIKSYSWKNQIPLIILAGILISGIFLLSYGFGSTIENLVHLGHGLTMTAGIWLGCMAIVTYLWKKYPWEQSPRKHLLLEIPLITIWTIIYSGTLYYFERRFDILPPPDNIIFEAVDNPLL